MILAIFLHAYNNKIVHYQNPILNVFQNHKNFSFVDRKVDADFYHVMYRMPL